jgi:hypothetical protein
MAKDTYTSIFCIECDNCGEEIFQVVAKRVVEPGMQLRGEVFCTCAMCGHTAQYVSLNEEGSPVWRGSDE